MTVKALIAGEGRAVPTIKSDTTLQDVIERLEREKGGDIGEPMALLLQLMDVHYIRHVPITRDGLLFGIVSILDIIKYRWPISTPRRDL